ncbi:hypothetical protein PT974_08028 [Cladobotryum mycophilum]|uniref:Uncharacterized protein n=1 Tax=Cladobotryum mycophilum TaxID=491253 RepID=A0ABR0SC61_9HYPO
MAPVCVMDPDSDDSASGRSTPRLGVNRSPSPSESMATGGSKTDAPIPSPEQCNWDQIMRDYGSSYKDALERRFNDRAKNQDITAKARKGTDYGREHATPVLEG